MTIPNPTRDKSLEWIEVNVGELRTGGSPTRRGCEGKRALVRSTAGDPRVREEVHGDTRVTSTWGGENMQGERHTGACGTSTQPG